MIWDYHHWKEEELVWNPQKQVVASNLKYWPTLGLDGAQCKTKVIVIKATRANKVGMTILALKIYTQLRFMMR